MISILFFGKSESINIIPDEIWGLSNLKHLYCGSNQLTSLVGIEKLYNLKILDCYGNKLTSLKGIEKLSNLKELEYNNNPIYDYICNVWYWIT